MLVCLLLSLAVLADSPNPFYTSKKLGLLVRQPPGWKVQESERLVVSEPGGTARARFEVLTGKDADAAWKKAAQSFEKEHPGFEVIETLVSSPSAVLVQARFKEAGADWTGSYSVRPMGAGRLLLSSSEFQSGAPKKVTDWVGAVVESATPTR